MIKVDRIDWSGHVYNLTSSEGWYSANGTIASNCDCLLVNVPDEQGKLPSQEWDIDEAIASGAITGLSVADRDAILNEDASLSRIVGHQSRGMSTPKAKPGYRPTVTDIYRRAGGDRGEAVRLLISMGYIVRT